VPVTGATITDLDLTYVRDRAAAVKEDLTALAAVDSVHGDNKAIQVDATNAPGLYRVDVADAAFAAGSARVQLVINGAAVDPTVIEVEMPVWLTAVTGATAKVDLQTWLTVAPLALSSQKVQASTDAAPTAAAIADAVLDEAVTGHTGHIANIPTSTTRGPLGFAG